VLLNNKATALKTRAVDNYNAWVKIGNERDKSPLKFRAAKDFELALDGFSKSWEILKNAAPLDITNQSAFDEAKINALSGGNDLIRILLVAKLLPESKKSEARELVVEYIKFETDKTKKIKARQNLQQIL
jgi:hypothetical protein